MFVFCLNIQCLLEVHSWELEHISTSSQHLHFWVFSFFVFGGGGGQGGPTNACSFFGRDVGKGMFYIGKRKKNKQTKNLLICSWKQSRSNLSCAKSWYHLADWEFLLLAVRYLLNCAMMTNANSLMNLPQLCYRTVMGDPDPWCFSYGVLVKRCDSDWWMKHVSFLVRMDFWASLDLMDQPGFDHQIFFWQYWTWDPSITFFGRCLSGCQEPRFAREMVNISFCG